MAEPPRTDGSGPGTAARSVRPTSQDVARAAGVSQATVSLVLGDKWPGQVSERTAGLVRDTARELGYRPNLAARNLRLGRTRTALLVVPALTHEYFARVYTGAARSPPSTASGWSCIRRRRASGPPGPVRLGAGGAGRRDRLVHGRRGAGHDPGHRSAAGDARQRPRRVRRRRHGESRHRGRHAAGDRPSVRAGPPPDHPSGLGRDVLDVHGAGPRRWPRRYVGCPGRSYAPCRRPWRCARRGRRPSGPCAARGPGPRR